MTHRLIALRNMIAEHAWEGHGELGLRYWEMSDQCACFVGWYHRLVDAVWEGDKSVEEVMEHFGLNEKQIKLLFLEVSYLDIVTYKSRHEIIYTKDSEGAIIQRCLRNLDDIIAEKEADIAEEARLLRETKAVQDAASNSPEPSLCNVQTLVQYRDNARDVGSHHPSESRRAA